MPKEIRPIWEKRRLTGEQILERLEAGLVDPEQLTSEQRERVLYAQAKREKESRKSLRTRERLGKRTRFGIGSWRYPTDKALKEARRKSKKLQM